MTSSFVTTDVGAGTVILSGTPTAAGSVSFTVNATDSAGATLTVDYTLTVFGIQSIVATPDGMVLIFNAPIDPASTVLYSSPWDITLGPPDITVVGATTGPVRGSLVIDPTNPDEATFVQTSGLLATDIYTVTVTTGVKAFGGATLGSNYTTTFNVTAPNTPDLSVPSFARGAGQAVDVPTSNTGLPIYISNATNVTQASFTLTYDPTILTIAPTGALTPMAGFASVTYSIISIDTHHSILSVNLSGGTGLTVGSTPVIAGEHRGHRARHGTLFQQSGAQSGQRAGQQHVGHGDLWRRRGRLLWRCQR